MSLCNLPERLLEGQNGGGKEGTGGELGDEVGSAITRDTLKKLLSERRWCLFDQEICEES